MMDDRTYFVELEPQRREGALAVSVSLHDSRRAADPVRVRYDNKRRVWVIDVFREGAGWLEGATVPGQGKA